MRYVTVPEDIQIMVAGAKWKDSKGNPIDPWSMSHYLENIVLADPSIGTTYAALKQSISVSVQFRDSKPGDVVAVEDAHWKMLKDTIEAPQGSGVASIVLRQLLPFMDAVLSATEKRPEQRPVVKAANPYPDKP